MQSESLEKVIVLLQKHSQIVSHTRNMLNDVFVYIEQFTLTGNDINA